jgi:hypothetical protein
MGLWPTLGASPANAGPLRKVVSGLRERSGQSKHSSGGGNSGGGKDSHVRDHREDSSDSDSGDFDDDDGDSGGNDRGWASSVGRSYDVRPMIFVGAYPYPTNTPGTDVRLYLGLHSVDDSSGALSGSIRSSYGSMGIEIDDIRYYERQSAAEGSDYLSLDVWSMSVAYRALAAGPEERTAVWLKGGLTGSHSEGLGIFGFVIGAEVAHNVGSAVGVESSARLFYYQDLIHALELRAGVAASVMRVSYRIMKFNVGPPLQGPEVGVSLSF